MPEQNKNIYNLTSEEVLKKFNASFDGLTENETKKRSRGDNSRQHGLDFLKTNI